MRYCQDCGIGEDIEMLAHRDGNLVCQECDAKAERFWVSQDPENNRHYLDTFSPHGD